VFFIKFFYVSLVNAIKFLSATFRVAQKVSHKLLSISLPNIDQFSNFFHRHILWKIVIKWLLSISPHLNCVTTLPCNLQVTAWQYRIQQDKNCYRICQQWLNIFHKNFSCLEKRKCSYTNTEI